MFTAVDSAKLRSKPSWEKFQVALDLKKGVGAVMEGQQVKGLAAEPDNLYFVPRTHMAEGKN